MRRFTEAEHVVQKSSTVSTEQPKNGRLSLKTIDFQKHTTLNVFVYYCYLFYLFFTVSKSACVSNPCVNGGTCVDATNNDGSLLEGVVFTNHLQYKCVCSKGYAGENCESELS